MPNFAVRTESRRRPRILLRSSELAIIALAVPTFGSLGPGGGAGLGSSGDGAGTSFNYGLGAVRRARNVSLVDHGRVWSALGRVRADGVARRMRPARTRRESARLRRNADLVHHGGLS